MKVFTLTFAVLLLLVTFAQATTVRRGDKRAAVAETKVSEAGKLARTDSIETVTDANTNTNTNKNTEKKEKEVHKRGILHYGANLAAAGSVWPKTYASNYGYGFHLPAATGFAAAAHPLTALTHLHASPALKYHGHDHGFHYKALASPAVIPAITNFNSAWPTYASLGPAVSHAHPVAPAQPFIIRPGGAVVQSYSVNYPHRKPALAVKPIHSFASIAPVAPVHHVPAIQPAVAAIQPVHSFQTVQAVQHVHPVQPVAAVSPVQHLTPIQTVQHLPVAPPPVQTVVQPTLIPSAPAAIPALPQAPVVGFSPAQAAFPAFPALPNPPDFPHIPSIPVIPSQPSVPDVPAVPAIPSVPTIPTIPSIPNFPQPQVPSNSFFPVNVQPPLNQNPPAFGSVNPHVQFPDFNPLAGSSPDFGSANAAPQIPVQPTGSREPQLPLPPGEATQTPWKPVLYEPPTAESPLARPSNTLLPPYGSSLAEGYLPPAPTSHSGRHQQEYTIDSSLFDNLSDADIKQILDEASLAAHRDHHHHTVHNYYTRY